MNGSSSQPLCAVYGSSLPKPEDHNYQIAQQVGRLLADNNIGVLTGGYYGTMEAVSRGASESEKKVMIEGVTVPTVFTHRSKEGNDYLNFRTYAHDMIDRLRRLTTATSAYICLPGAVGTMTELVTVWNQIYCEQRASSKFEMAEKRIIVCFRDPWEEFVKSTIRAMKFSESPVINEYIFFVDTPEEAVKMIVDFFKN